MNTHAHFDHTFGNQSFGPDATPSGKAVKGGRGGGGGTTRVSIACDRRGEGGVGVVARWGGMWDIRPAGSERPIGGASGDVEWGGGGVEGLGRVERKREPG